MKSPIRKIGLILVFVVILPALFFAVYELASLSESEEVIEEIYSRQLEAILYSVNQYSEDAVSAWSGKINRSILPGGKTPDEGLINEFLNENGAVRMLVLSDTLSTDRASYYYSSRNVGASDAGIRDSLKNAVRKVFKDYSPQIRHLYTYRRGGYRKILPLRSEGPEGNVFLVFLLDQPEEGRTLLCALALNAPLFIRQVMAPRIQQVARNEFFIAVADSSRNNSLLYSSGRMRNASLKARKALWLLPGYYLGITLRGETIENLVRKRTYTNIALIASLIGVLLVGVYFVLRNIKREIELAQTKSDFVSNVSHELRTPLALISMFAETLEMGRVRTEEKKQEYYSIISREAGRLGKIVNKILNFSRMEAGKVKYNLTDTDINDVVENICSTYSFHLKNNGFEYRLVMSPSLPSIHADRESLGEAVINLIDNGMKYSGSEKFIRIATGSAENMVFVEVSDKGIGISQENQKKIFDKFYRITSGEVHNTKGTGLGLTIVRHIMEAHKGKIEVESSPDKGSTFRLLFPKCETKV